MPANTYTVRTGSASGRHNMTTSVPFADDAEAVAFAAYLVAKQPAVWIMIYQGERFVTLAS